MNKSLKLNGTRTVECANVSSVKEEGLSCVNAAILKQASVNKGLYPTRVNRGTAMKSSKHGSSLTIGKRYGVLSARRKWDEQPSIDI